MRFPKFLLTTIVTIIVILSFANPALNQSGTQSNNTVPNPAEISPKPRTVGNPRSAIALDNISIDRQAFERNFQQVTAAQAVQLFEELQAVEFGKYLGLNFYGSTTSAEQIAQSLCNLAESTGKKTALIYVVSLEDRLDLLTIVPNPKPCTTTTNKQNNDDTIIFRETVPEANRKELQKLVRDFRAGITDRMNGESYQSAAKQLYKWIITPLESQLSAKKIDSLVFCMDKGLRSLPIAALYDGDRFIIEKYSVGLIPSFSLTDTRYVPVSNSLMLAMGISKSTQGQTPLPGVSVEVPTIINQLWQGRAFMNEESTLDKLKFVASKQRFGIIHIATHAEFKPGNIDQSYIQFWNYKLKIDRLKQLSQTLGWHQNPKVEMLVLSACKTAVGNEQAELGFAGLAVQAGVKTAIGSLWYASDEGSLALMTEFYHQLRTANIKTEAMRAAQLGMLKGQVRVENGQLVLSDNRRIALSSELVAGDLKILSHPYYWSGYTTIGNWN